MKLNWNFLGGRGGGGGGCKTKTFHVGSMDIFWNCTLQSKVGQCMSSSMDVTNGYYGSNRGVHDYLLSLKMTAKKTLTGEHYFAYVNSYKLELCE